MDLFFTSGYDINVLLRWSADIRNSLLGLNISAVDANRHILQILAETNDFTYDKYLLSQKNMQDQNNTLKKNRRLGDLVSYETVLMNIVNKKMVDTIISAQASQTETMSQIMSNSIQAEEDYQKLGADRNNQFGYSRSYTPADTKPGEISTATPKFPQHNQPYDNHMASISTDMNNRDTFTTFTGATDTTNPTEINFKSWAKINKDQSRTSDPSKTFTEERPYSDFINEVIRNNDQAIPMGTYKFFIEKLHGRYSNGKPYKKNPIKSSNTGNSKNQIPLELSNRMLFAAYIDNYNETFSTEVTEYNFIGRGEGVPVYQRTRRNITLEFSILADYSSEMMTAMSKLYSETNNLTTNNIDDQLTQIVKNFPDWGLGTLPLYQFTEGPGRVGNHIPGLYSDTPESLWAKSTFLAQCVYPYYRSDGKMKEQPMVRIRIADFYDIIGVIRNISTDLNVLEGIQIDLNPSNIGNIPLAVKFTLSIDVYHDYEPTSNFYGFYHRKEFDTGIIDPVTGGGSLGVAKKQLDTITENITKNSPTSIFNRISNESLLDTPSILGEAFDQLKQNVFDLRTGLQNIVNSGMNLKETALNIQAKKSMQAYMRIQSVVNTLRIQQGLGPLNADLQNGVNNFVNSSSNISKGLLNGINNTNTIITNLTNKSKDNFSDLLVEATNTVNKVTDNIKQTNQAVISSLPTLKDQTMKTIQDNIDNIKSVTKAPKTMQEIIDAVNRKVGPKNQTDDLPPLDYNTNISV